MKYAIVVLLLTVLFHTTVAQSTEPGVSYHPTAEKKLKLVHTRLEASFDYAKSQLYGKASLTLTPYFYATDSVQLDAKGMDIHRVALNDRDLPFRYDGFVLFFKLDRRYRAGEEFIIDIRYTAKPSGFQGTGSAAITDARGMYFINPLGKEKGKPTQIWTQGETEATSVWCPTIDRPNQKSTSEMLLRVPAQYVSLSNGKLVNQVNNADGTRTDHWRMDLPHAPYLFFIGIGDYAVIRDKYGELEVDYYVEKEYAPVARKIFGDTPAMIALFERLIGVPFPWNKYSQMTARDYVSGAMENTTATLHGSSAQQDARQLVDENAWEPVVAHELFHQWFGNYVTAESWGNLPMNEAFATYAEYLWAEHKHGPEEAHRTLYDDRQTYLTDSSAYDKDLIRFRYADREDMFDNVSYQKGGAVLHMLRAHVGDSAFFKGLHQYLVTNKFGNAEAHELRLVLEDITGQDLNWFFDQWFFNSGHPVVDISYDYSKDRQVTVTISQLQPYVFRFPLKIDVWEGTRRTTYPVVIDEAVERFTFPCAGKPDLVNVDADKFMLWQKSDQKTIDNFLFQYTHGNFVDRLEAVYAAAATLNSVKSQQLVRQALKDRSARIRTDAITILGYLPASLKSEMKDDILEILKNDRPLVQAEAIDFFASPPDPQYADLFRQHINDSSYTVAGNALMALAAVDPKEATAAALRLKAMPAKGNLADGISDLLMETKNPAHFKYIMNYFGDLPWYQAAGIAQTFAEYLAVLKDDKMVMQGVELLSECSRNLPAGYKPMFGPTLAFAIQHVADSKKTSGKKRLAAEIQKHVTGI